MNENEKNQIKEENKKNSRKKEILSYIKTIFGTFIVVMLFMCFIAQPVRVNGMSMYPTLKNGQYLLVDKMHSTYERGDIVVSKLNNIFIIKRVIGLPGETIQIKNNNIYINGNKIDDYVDIEMADYGIAANPIKLGDEEYFLMGDNRNDSYDSRKEAVGVINEDRILGAICFRAIPFTKY